MIQAVLFDLDGTLLHNDFNGFMSQYLKSISARVAHLMPPKEFVTHLLAATEQMLINCDPALTNEQVFARAFERLSGRQLSELMPALDDFYATEFGQLSACTARRPEARTLVESILARGRQAVVATNPLFPMTAIRQRLEWAGVADLPFALVTSYENMHAAKPHREYYEEIARCIGVPASACVMVGDDLEMDAPCVRAGMRFYRFIETPPFDDNQGDLTHLQTCVEDGWLDH